MYLISDTALVFNPTLQGIKVIFWIVSAGLFFVSMWFKTKVEKRVVGSGLFNDFRQKIKNAS